MPEYKGMTEICGINMAATQRKLMGSAALGATSILANTVTAVGTITVTGAVLGDIVDGLSSLLAQPSTLLFAAEVTSADTVTVKAVNTTAGNIAATATTWRAVVSKV